MRGNTRWISKNKPERKLSWPVKADKSLGLLLKVAPITPVLGGILLLLYLHIIGKPDLFMSAVGSLNGLIALLLVGILVCLLFALVFVAPVGFARGVITERANVYEWADVSRWKIIGLFVIFPLVLIALSMLIDPWPESIPVLLLGLIFLLSLWVLLPTQSYPEVSIRGWGSREWHSLINIMQQQHIKKIVLFFWLGGRLAFAVSSMSWALLLIGKFSSLKGMGDAITIGFILVYSLFVGIIILILVKNNNWKIEATIIGVIALLMLIYLSDAILISATSILGIRHDTEQLYWVADDKKISAILPRSIRHIVRGEGSCLYAATPFSFGDARVLCATKDGKISLDECVVLDKAEVRLSGQHTGNVNLCVAP